MSMALAAPNLSRYSRYLEHRKGPIPFYLPFARRRAMKFFDMLERWQNKIEQDRYIILRYKKITNRANNEGRMVDA